MAKDSDRSKKGGDEERVVQGKKRKASSVIIHQNGPEQNTTSPAKKPRTSNQPTEDIAMDMDIDTSRPTAVFKPTTGRSWTVSIALPGSWLNNAKKPDHKTLLVGRIARAAAVFCVDEIVVFDDDPVNIDPKVVAPKYIGGKKSKSKTKQEILDSILEEDEPWQNPDQFLYHVLSFAECPPHLRMTLFPKHANLSQVGSLPSLDMPHHLKAHEWCQYREGAVLGPAPAPSSKSKSKSKIPSDEHEFAFIEVGLPSPIRVPIPPSSPVEAGMRTTVRFASASAPPNWPHLSQQQCEDLDAVACSNAIPREEGGYYWGYTVRRATSLSAVLTESEYEGGYDVTMGTSERGVALHSILPSSASTSTKSPSSSSTSLPTHFQHLLLVFGGVAGIEPAVANDPELVKMGLGKGNASTLFDAWVNLVPGQGSRTIRTEEAVEFGLCAVEPWVRGRGEA